LIETTHARSKINLHNVKAFIRYKEIAVLQV